MKTRWMALALMLAWLGTAGAGPLEDGVAAYQKGQFDAALKGLKPLADAGNPRAQVVLGLMYYNGQGVAEDVNRAYQLFRQSAEKGDAEGQYRLGYVYTVGFGVPADITDPNKRAAEWYGKAAAQGHAEAQFHLGMLYLAGTGVTASHETGMDWIRKSAKGGFAEAQEFLGDYKK